MQAQHALDSWHVMLVRLGDRESLEDGCEGKIVWFAEFLHVKPGKGAAFVRSKLKNYLNGSNLEKTFRAGEPLEGAIVEKRDTQYTYLDGSQVNCCINDWDEVFEPLLVVLGSPTHMVHPLGAHTM